MIRLDLATQRRATRASSNTVDAGGSARRASIALAAALLASIAAGCGQEGAETAPAADTAGSVTELGYEVIVEGDGASPSAKDSVTVHYTGRLENGDVFDSSVERGKPSTFPLNRVIKCWTQGLQMMKVGGKATLTCPSDIAYGARGRPGKIPPNATLIFEIELLEIE
jgi:FKBP-type peptidyl-prolyl cis-trans isomerase FkpA